MTFIDCDAFVNCRNLTLIEVHESLCHIIIKNAAARRTKINENLGTLYNVFHNKLSFSLISQKVYQLLGMDGSDHDEVNDGDVIFINWKLYSQRKNKQGRLPLFTAAEQSVPWSDGVEQILKSYGPAIEFIDVVTGLEVFMLAAVGTNSNIETIFKLLQDHPAALNPYVPLLFS